MTDSPSVTERARQLTPTGNLIMEVLGARRRLGERCWTFPSNLTHHVRRLEDDGRVTWKHGVVEDTVLVWLTEAGEAEALDDAYTSPLERQLVARDRRDCYIPDDTLALADAAVEVADVLPDGWSAAVAFEDNSVEIHEVPGWPQTYESFRAAVCPLSDRRWGARFIDDEGPDTDRDTPRDAALAALHALGAEHG